MKSFTGMLLSDSRGNLQFVAQQKVTIAMDLSFCQSTIFLIGNTWQTFTRRRERDGRELRWSWYRDTGKADFKTECNVTWLDTRTRTHKGFPTGGDFAPQGSFVVLGGHDLGGAAGL